MPPPGGSAPGQYSPIDAVKYAWTKFTQNLGPFLGVTAIVLAVGIGLNMLINLALTGSVLSSAEAVDPQTGLPDNFVQMQLANVVGSFLTGFVSWALGLALLRGALDVVDTGRTSFGEMFSRIPWGQALLAGLLVWLATTIGVVLCILPGLVAMFLLYYTNVAVLEGRSATDAIGASFTFVKDHLAENLLLLLVALGLVILAICTCGLGMLVVTPLLTIAQVYTWRVLQGRPVA
ncbi:MAG TPA: hypothetical protein DER11_03350 [Janibacter terrae]|nr:hypothetical protein [Janibacter terrae]